MCATCVVTVSGGTPDHRDAVFSAEDHAEGRFATCVSLTLGGELIRSVSGSSLSHALYPPATGNSQKVRIALRLLGLTFAEVPLVDGRHRHPDFLALNPLGHVPVVDDDGLVIRGSGAILTYLATRYRPGE